MVGVLSCRMPFWVFRQLSRSSPIIKNKLCSVKVVHSMAAPFCLFVPMFISSLITLQELIVKISSHLLHPSWYSYLSYLRISACFPIYSPTVHLTEKSGHLEINIDPTESAWRKSRKEPQKMYKRSTYIKIHCQKGKICI